MNTYKVRGLYTISFEMEVEADSRAEAEEMGYNTEESYKEYVLSRFEQMAMRG